MNVTEDMIDHIAHLARLEFNGEEKQAIREDMSKILSFMDVLQQIDTQDVEPLMFMTQETNRLREDIAQETLSQVEVLKNAPKKDSDYFRISKVLDK